jgi:uncharacterized protein YjbJ (UPF0337 family)
MITRQELEGQWNQVKGRVKERWGELTENDLQQVKGDADQLVGVIQQRTGETRRQIEDFLDSVMSEGASTVSRAAETAREYADQAGAAVRDGYEHVAESVRAGYDEAQTMVRRNPVESVAVAFGAGIITGVIVGLVLRSR